MEYNMKIKKSFLRKVILEEFENAAWDAHKQDKSDASVQFLIEQTWIGQIANDENIRELCEILAPEAIKEGKYEKFGINQQVSRIFENYQQRIIEELQQIAYDNELEEEPSNDRFRE